MLNFASALLSSTAFLQQVSASLRGDGESIDQQLQLLIQCAILNIDTYVRETRSSKIHRSGTKKIYIFETKSESSRGLKKNRM